MKKLIGIIILAILCSHSYKENTNEYRDITQKLSIRQFENIKTFIIEYGDRQTYCNMYNNNPHYSFEGFETYLNPEIGKRNINCDSGILDFNEIVIRDHNSDPQYYYILIVRQGDLNNKEIVLTAPGMKENKVYLLKYYDDDLDLMENNISGYLEMIKNKINKH